MKIILLGANGRTGREVLSHALNAGDSVTALVRAEDRLADVTHSRLKVHVGNVFDPNVLKAIIPGHDVVISTLGPRMPTRDACAIYSGSATAIVEAMQECGTNRLLVTSTALLYPSDKLLDRILGSIARHNARNAGLMEETICESGLEWTIARMGFLNNKSSIDFRLAEGALPDRCGPISRAAVAHFLLTEAKQSHYVNKVVGLCG
jgi:putative NADH-flavin reductase